MSAVMSATLGATIAASQELTSQQGTEPETIANPNISGTERFADNVLDVVESPEYNYGVMGTFGTLAVIQGSIGGYAAAASAVGGACSLSTAGAALGAASGAATALAPLAIAVVAGTGGFTAGEWTGHGIASLMGMNQVATEGEAPARKGDAIAHQNKTWAVLGAIAGVIAGVAVVAVIGALTGGAGLVVLGSSLLGSMATAGAAAAVGGLIAGIGSALGQYGDNKGFIAEGSPNVFLNNKPVARATDPVSCSEHVWTVPPVIAERAKTVFANNKPIARLGHRTSCDGNINSGSANIAVTQQTGILLAEIKDSRNIFVRSVSALLNTVLTAVGLKQSISGIGHSIKQTAAAGEPVDVVTGDFLQQWPVIHLEGVLPLTLERVYRSGKDFDVEGYFGKKWACDWSQYLELRKETIDYLNEEGIVLHYHAPENNVKAINMRQPQYILCGSRKNGLAIYNKNTRQTLTFSHKIGSRRYLSSIEDGNNNRIDFFYDKNGLVAIKHSDGYQLVIESKYNLIQSVDLLQQEERQRLLTCQYNADGLLTDCHSFQFGRLFHEYTEKGYMHHWRDTAETKAFIHYDDRGRVLSTKTSRGFYNDRFVYDEENRHTIYIDAEGGETHYFYNEADLVIRVIDPLGFESRTEWELTRIIAETDKLGRVTRFNYNDLGDITEIIHPDNKKTQYKYDAKGFITAVKDSADKEWLYYYETTGLLRRVINPAEVKLEYRYDPHGRLLRATCSDGREWRYHYDAFGQLAETVDPQGISTRYKKDLLGRVWHTTDPLGQCTRYEHSTQHASPEGSVTVVYFPDGTSQQINYDSERRIGKQKDGEGRTTEYYYDAFDLLTGCRRPGGEQITYHYDRLTRLTGITNASGENYHLKRDLNGRVTEERDFTGRKQLYSYDAAGRLKVKQEGSQTTTYHYDIYDRLVKKTCWLMEETVSVCQEAVVHEYNAVGQLVKADNGHSVVEFSYDSVGRLTGEKINGRQASYQFDVASGNIVAQHLDDLTLHFSWLPGGLLRSIQPGSHAPLEFTRDGGGREILRRSETGFVLAQYYARNGLLSHQAGGTDSLIMNRTPLSEGYRPLSGNTVNRRYEYDRAFNVTLIDDGHWGKSRYGYNANGQVESAYLGGVNGSVGCFNYDADLNISNRRIIRRPWVGRDALNTRPDEISALQNQGGRAVSCGPYRYSYNEQGQLTEKQEERDGFRPLVWKYRWSLQGQLSEIQTPDRRRWRYVYDAFGRRIRKLQIIEGGRWPEREAAQTQKRITGTEYFWCGEQMVQETPLYADGTRADERAVHWLYTPGGLAPVARYSAGRLHYVVTDQFDLHNFYEDNKEEVTGIDVFKVIELSNGYYCCIGEGSYGSEGFIAYLDSNKDLVWVIYSESSNPFINAVEDDSGNIVVESSAKIKLKININDPVNLALIK